MRPICNPINPSNIMQLGGIIGIEKGRHILEKKAIFIQQEKYRFLERLPLDWSSCVK